MRKNPELKPRFWNGYTAKPLPFWGHLRYILLLRCRCGEMADAADLKSAGGNPVRVRVPPAALRFEIGCHVHLMTLDRPRNGSVT